MGTARETLSIDGRQPISAELAAQVGELCDRVEDIAGRGPVVVHVSGTPAQGRNEGLTVATVSRWERALRRLERLPATIVGVADAEVGGPALDALLATDYRIATPSVRLTMPVDSGATWPGMALYRLAQQGSNTAAVRRALLFGHPIAAREALALQLVDEVTEDVAGALAAVAELTGVLSGRELAIRRQLMTDAATTSFEEALGVHLAACDRTLRLVATEAAS
ncbi:enoyl-CoA-hydratase DpgB [Streptomyces hyaluromycini]|uniref:Enoyl-CoA-hydratase DpgB n=1 Tax=Streptomyces hyaluromycini TaxID=1377993 RepID=A0ABV1WMV3_9ACTN